MEIALGWLTSKFGEDPAYWAGIIIWGLGFTIYLYSGFARQRPTLNRISTALCWAGFTATVLGSVTRDWTPSGGPVITLPAFNPVAWQEANNLIWLLWISGGFLIVLSWLRLASHRVGWLGLCVGMTAVVASWPNEESTQLAILAAGSTIVLLLFLLSLQRGQLPREVYRPGDYQAELVRLCHGDKRMAERLIRHELRQSPELSRAGAALAAVTRLRHERGGYPSPL